MTTPPVSATPSGEELPQQRREHEHEEYGHGDADARQRQQASQPPQRHHRHREHDSEDDEWQPALNIGERVAGCGVDVGAGVVEHDVVSHRQLRHRGPSGDVGLQCGGRAGVRPAGYAGADAVALGLGVVATWANLGCCHGGIDSVAVAEGLPVDRRVAMRPPDRDSHQRRDDQDGDDAAQEATHRRCV
jgi:hypothetical protein